MPINATDELSDLDAHLAKTPASVHPSSMFAPEASTPRTPSTYPSTEYFDLVRTLVRHRLRLDYVHIVATRLRMNDECWERIHSDMISTVVPQTDSRFGRLPEGIVQFAQRLQAEPEFEEWKLWTIECLTCKSKILANSPAR